MSNKPITRRGFMSRLSQSTLVTTFPIFLKSCSVSKKRPNFIFLLTDDQRWDTFGAMGNKIIRTPNMDNLAQNGVRFANAYVTTAICCTSRASIFLGQYARRHDIHNFSKDFTAEQLSQTYDMLLKNAGYQIGFIGKYGVGRNLPAEHYDYWRGIAGQPIYEQNDENGTYKHLTRIMGEQSIEFLNHCNPDQPFCLSVSFKAPHVQDNDPRQFIYDPVYKNLYLDDEIPIPVTAADKYFYEKFPDFFTQDNEARRRWEIRFSTPEKYQESVKGYYRLITGVDVVIGEIREELKKLGMAENTVIILHGDNGFYLGEHGMAGKWYGHEESIRVPLIIYDPRLPKRHKGQVKEEMVLNIDVAPTILDLAGLSIPENIQGKSLRSFLTSNPVNWRDEFFYEHLFDRFNIPKSEGVIGKRYKYLRYMQQEPVYEEFYDLNNDPHEVTNLALNSQFKTLLSEYRQKCDYYTKKLR